MLINYCSLLLSKYVNKFTIIFNNFIIYNGGPVEQDNLYFIHNVPDLIPNSIEISKGIYWGGDFDFTKELINTGVIKKKNIRFFLEHCSKYDGIGHDNENNAKINTVFKIKFS